MLSRNNPSILIVSFLFFFSCSTQNSAPILKGENIYNEKSQISIVKIPSVKKSNISNNTAKSRDIPVMEMNPEVKKEHINDSDSDQRKYLSHEVLEGENLELIAKRYDVSVKDLQEVNNINLELEELQIIKIPISKNNNPKLLQKDKIFIWPANGEVKSFFGQKINDVATTGINIYASQHSKVVSVSDSVVTYVGYDKKFGNLVITKNTDMNIKFAYAHLENITVNSGDELKQGDVIGFVGNSGQVERAQLYFAIEKEGNPVDPLIYIKP